MRTGNILIFLKLLLVLIILAATFASGSEAFVNHWLFTFLKEKYGADYKKMEPYGIVVLDMPMEYNTSEYSQAPFGDSGIEQQVYSATYRSKCIISEPQREKSTFLPIGKLRMIQ